MTSISVTGHFQIDDGKFEEFKSVVDKCIQTTIEKDKETTQYEWLENPAKNEVVVLERYKNSDALILHATSVAPYIEKMQTLATASIQVYGEPNEALAEMLSGMGIPVFTQFASI